MVSEHVSAGGGAAQAVPPGRQGGQALLQPHYDDAAAP